jgi:putative glutamine amidotransferase
MPALATWIRPCDDKWFRPIFERYPGVTVRNACAEEVSLADVDGLLLSGGPDVGREFLKQEIPDPTLIRDAVPARDRWEFAAVESALERGLPILAICKGMQLFNVALGGTLKLDIPDHNAPELRNANVQPLRVDRNARHQFEAVNSAHHQAIDRLGANCETESWCAADDIIEQIRLSNYPFALGVQYHPERDTMYLPLFDDFVSQLKD